MKSLNENVIIKQLFSLSQSFLQILIVYEIETNDASEQFYMNKDTFVFDEYPEYFTVYNVKNKRVITEMKEEIKNVRIVYFVE